MGLLLCAALALSPAAQMAQGRPAAGPAAGTGLARAVLARGPEPQRGLPFFSPNAIPALRAEYLIVPAASTPTDAAGAVEAGRRDPLVRVWFTRAAVVLGKAWVAVEAGDRGARLLARPEGRPVLAILDGRYSLFFELPEDGPAPRAFAAALDRRFAVFFESAPSDAELSLPAFVDFR